MSKRDGIYKRKDRPGYWISWNNAQGKRRYRKTNAQTLADARNIRAAELLKVDKARTLGFNPPGEETFKDLVGRYLSHQKVRVSQGTYDREKGIIEKHFSTFFTLKISAIRRADIQRYITKRSGMVSAGTVVKELNTLKHFLNLAVEWEIIPFSPIQGIKSPRVPAGRVRYLQPTELKVLIESSPNWLQPIIVLAVSSGMRRSEILKLRWLDVDMTHQRIMLPQTKNGDGRIVYMNKMAVMAVQSIPFSSDSRSTDRLFTDLTPGQVSVTFHRVCKSVGIEDCRFHDLRHTAASWLRMQGADIHTVAQLLGHKDLRMAARYQHLSPAYLADAVGRLDEVFGLIRYQDVTGLEGNSHELTVSA